MTKSEGLHYMVECPFCARSRAVFKLSAARVMVLFCPLCKAKAYLNSPASLTTMRIHCPVEVAALESALATKRAAIEASQQTKQVRIRKAKNNEAGAP